MIHFKREETYGVFVEIYRNLPPMHLYPKLSKVPH